MRQIILFAFLLHSSFLLLSQPIIDDFNDNVLTGWSPANAGGNLHTLTEANGELRVDFSIANPNAFPNTVKSFPAPVDLSVFSQLTLKLKTSTPLAQISNIRIDFVDTGGLSTSMTPFNLNPILVDGKYHTYSFDFGGKWRHLTGVLMDSTKISNMLLFINVGAGGNPGGSGTIYIDEIVMALPPCSGTVADPRILDDFECQRNLTGLSTSGTLSLVDNPDVSTFNTSAKAAKYVRSNSPFDVVIGNFPGGSLDLTTFNKLKVQTIAPAGTNFQVSLQDGTANTLAAASQVVTASGEWEELVFNFSASAAVTGVTRMVLLVNPNIPTAETVYLDNIRMDSSAVPLNECSGTPIDNKILDDFECQRNLVGLFTSGTLSLVENPDTSTFNTSVTAGKYIRSNAAFDVFIGNFPGGGLDLSTFNKLKIQTLAPIGTNFQVSLQDAGGNQLAGAAQSVTTTGEWQELVFNLSASAAVTGITKMVLLVNPNIAVVDTVYLDNIRMDSSAVALNACSGTAIDNKILDDFECQRNLVGLFTSGALSLVGNPDTSTFNTSVTAAKYIRSNAAYDVFIGDFPGGSLNLSVFNKLKVQTLAQPGTNIQVSLQDGAGNTLAAASKVVTVPDEWEELVFDFSASAAVTGITRMVLLVNPNIPVVDTVYLDNIRMDSSAVPLNACSGTAIDNKILDDFECQRNLVGLFSSGALSLVDNPDASTFNTSETAGKYIRSNAPFDVFIGDFPGGGLDLSTFNKLKVQTIAQPGTNIQVSLQNGAGNTLAAASKVVTLVGEWEELVFDFSASAAVTGITRMVLLVNPNIAVVDTVYLDNIRMDSSAVALNACSGTPIDLAVMDDFECQRNLTGLFTSGTLSLVDNPDNTGINTSETAGKYRRSNNNFDLILGNFSGGELDLNEFNLVRMQFRSPIANVPVQVTLNSVNGGQLMSQTRTGGLANVWNEIVFDFSVLRDSMAKSIVFLINPGTTLVDTFYLDNLRLDVVDPCAGVTLDTTVIEDFDCQRNLTDVITSGNLAVVSNPAPGITNISIRSGQYIRTTSPLDAYRGTFATGFQDLSANSHLKLQVYAPLAGFPVSVALQDLAGNEIARAERSARFAGKWEELTFDFSSVDTAANVSRLVLQLNPGATAPDTFLLDNLRWTTPPVQPDPCDATAIEPGILDDFECQRNLAQVRFDGVLDTEANPGIGTDNPSAISGKYLRSANANDAIYGAFRTGSLDLDSLNHIGLQVWAPAAGVEITLSLLDMLGIVLGTQTATIANAGAWEDLDFDFSALTTNTNVRRFTLSINPGNAVAGTYYLDNFRLTSSSVAIDPVAPVAAFRYYPNPATDQVVVEFELDATEAIQIELQDLTGKRVAALPVETRSPGFHKLSWDMPAVANGIYFLRITTPRGATTGKLIIRR